MRRKRNGLDIADYLIKTDEAPDQVKVFQPQQPQQDINNVADELERFFARYKATMNR